MIGRGRGERSEEAILGEATSYRRTNTLPFLCSDWFQPYLTGVEQQTEQHQEQHCAHHVSLHMEGPPQGYNPPQHLLKSQTTAKHWEKMQWRHAAVHISPHLSPVYIRAKSCVQGCFGPVCFTDISRLLWPSSPYPRAPTGGGLYKRTHQQREKTVKIWESALICQIIFFDPCPEVYLVTSLIPFETSLCNLVGKSANRRFYIPVPFFTNWVKCAGSRGSLILSSTTKIFHKHSTFLLRHYQFTTKNPSFLPIFTSQ